MIIVSDTNVLSSLAAAEALPLLSRLFTRTTVCISPAILQELRVGLDRGIAHLESVVQAVSTNEIQVLDLSPEEQDITQRLPQKLHAGEREAIALCQSRQLLLLSNDKRAVRYCREQSVKVVDLPTLLRLLWTRHVIARDEVSILVEKMEQVEKLKLPQVERLRIFAPRRRK